MSKARKIYDGTDVALVDSSGNLNVVLAAGTNAVGKLAANSGVDIGDVDVTSIAAGTNILGSIGGLGILVPASVELNSAIGADVDAAVAADANLRLMGYSARESAGTPAIASAMIVNGATGAAAGKVAQIALAASTSQTVWFGPEGISCPLGLSIDWIAGQLEIVMYYKVVAIT